MYVIKERMFAVGDDFDIDDDGRRLYYVDGKVLTLRDRLVIEDPSGNEVAAVHLHLVALRPTAEVTIGGEKVAAAPRSGWHAALTGRCKNPFVITYPLDGYAEHTFGPACPCGMWLGALVLDGGPGR